jgi:hypothetical protein
LKRGICFFSTSTAIIRRTDRKTACGGLHSQHTGTSGQRLRRCLKTGIYRFSTVLAITTETKDRSNMCHVLQLPPFMTAGKTDEIIYQNKEAGSVPPCFLEVLSFQETGRSPAPAA